MTHKNLIKASIMVASVLFACNGKQNSTPQTPNTEQQTPVDQGKDEDDTEIDKNIASFHSGLSASVAKIKFRIIAQEYNPKDKRTQGFKLYNEYLSQFKDIPDSLYIANDNIVSWQMASIRKFIGADTLNQDGMPFKITELISKSEDYESFRSGLDRLEGKNKSERKLLKQTKKLVESIKKQYSAKGDCKGWWKCWGKCVFSVVGGVGTAIVTGGSGTHLAYVLLFGSISASSSCDNLKFKLSFKK